MDRSSWEKTLTGFQASARGYLVRNEVRRAREDFEDVVREIDGGLVHLAWRGAVIPTPRFTDTDGPFLRPSNKPSDPGLGVCAGAQSPYSSSSSSPSAPWPEERGDPPVLLEKTEAERDDPHTTKGRASLSKDCFTSRNVRGDGERQRENSVVDKDGDVMESTGDSTTVWSSLELDMNCGRSHKSPRKYCLAQEVPCTPEALRLHRNTLTMELLWLQQAIDSRKKYLSLKDRLSIT